MYHKVGISVIGISAYSSTNLVVFVFVIVLVIVAILIIVDEILSEAIYRGSSNIGPTGRRKSLSSMICYDDDDDSDDQSS